MYWYDAHARSVHLGIKKERIAALFFYRLHLCKFLVVFEAVFRFLFLLGEQLFRQLRTLLRQPAVAVFTHDEFAIVCRRGLGNPE